MYIGGDFFDLRSSSFVLFSLPFVWFGLVWLVEFFSLPAACRLSSRGVIFTRARDSLALLSLRKNGGLLVV